MERCGQCGFVYGDVAAESVAGRLLALPPRYAHELTAAERDGLARTRPAPATWSALEYTCHVRDVFDVQRERLALALGQERPVFASMRRDERAVQERYNEQDTAAVLAELGVAAERLAAALRGLDAAQWQRTGTYPWPEPVERTMAWVARHTMHEGLHHLDDVRDGQRRLRAGHAPK